MRFGPEVNDALGGRLEGNIYLLPNHCAAILRALLFSRPSARLKIGGITGEAGGDIFEMDFRTPDIREFGDVLNFRRQEGFTDVRDLTRVISSKSVCAYFLRRGQNECVAIIQSTQSNAFRPRAYKTVASLPTLLPGLFAGNPLSETEKALLAAAYKEDCGTIEGILETLYKESDLCNVRQKQMLHSVISHSMNADLNRMRSEAQQHEHNAGLALRNYMDNTNAAMEKKILAEDIERRIGGMSQVVDDIMDFMKISHAAISKCLGFWARGIGYSTTGRWRLTMALVLYRPSNGPKPDVAGMKHRLQAGALLPPSAELQPRVTAGEHVSEPIKSLEDIARVSQYLIRNRRYRDNIPFHSLFSFHLLKRFCTFILHAFSVQKHAGGQGECGRNIRPKVAMV